MFHISNDHDWQECMLVINFILVLV